MLWLAFYFVLTVHPLSGPHTIDESGSLN
jgi:hypothetical protein